MKASDLKKKPETLPKTQYVMETLDFGRPINKELAVDLFGSDLLQDLADIKGIGIVFTRDKLNRPWKVMKKDDEIYAERDYMLEGDSIVFEDENTAISGIIVSISENTMIIEGGASKLSESVVDEGAGRWISIVAMLGLLGLSINQILDTGAPEKTPLGAALAHARDLGDKDAGDHLRNLGRYIETGDWDKIAQLNDTYLNVKFDENQAADAITKTFGAMADSISSGTIRRAGMLAMQGRHSEAEGAMRQQLSKMDPDVAKKVQDSIRKITPVTVNGKVADTASLEKSKQHTDWLDNTFVPWVLKLTASKVDESASLKSLEALSDKYLHDGKLKENAEYQTLKAVLTEAEYKGREVKLGKPMRGDVKKFKVYVKDPKTGNVKKVNFGDKNMEIKRDDPDRRRSFRARHGCGTARASDRTKAAYWSCRMWSSKPVSKIVKED
jgi:hypothetical protein